MPAGNCSIASCVNVPVPVPPSTQGFNTKSNEYNRYNRSYHTSVGISNECGWAYKMPEVQRACLLAHVCQQIQPKYCRCKTDVIAITQNGPTCGLTALNMLTGGIPTPDDLLKYAKEQKFTNHGEMFCTKHLMQLAVHIFNKIDHPVAIECFSGQLNCDRIKTELRNGACLLVAFPYIDPFHTIPQHFGYSYDSDFNHAPCLKNGHKAHWALIIGCLIDDQNQFYVFGRHGKTKNLALWSLDSLSDSNGNLNEYTAPHRYDEYSFQMPIDGIAGENGLKNQCIIINNIKHIDEFIYPEL